ncbi:MAG: YeeE/YedE family protein [Pseudomonadota bacterium]
MENLIDRFGEPALMCVFGALIGAVFGAAAQRSRFCLRAAAVELSEGTPGTRISIWLVAFSAALAAVQGAVAAGWFDPSSTRQLAATGSLSGAVIGGLMFGAGMILARGCVSRLLVLSATGNLRAIVTGLVVTIVAQAALRGVLAPARESLAEIWTVQGGAGRLLGAGVPSTIWALLAVGAFGAAWAFGRHCRVPLGQLVGATTVGLAVFGGWALTYALSMASFEVVAVQSVTFTGPSTDTLMALVSDRAVVPSFGLGLVPGVFAGAMVMALLRGEARVQRFGTDTPMERYLLGGVLMGFGSMLAGGCAVGAGMTGGSIMALTAWLAVFCMWLGAMATHTALRALPALRGA